MFWRCYVCLNHDVMCVWAAHLWLIWCVRYVKIVLTIWHNYKCLRVSAIRDYECTHGDNPVTLHMTIPPYIYLYVAA